MTRSSRPTSPGNGRTNATRAHALSTWLDDRYLDPVLGLLAPGVGDVLGTVVGIYIVGVAVYRRLPGVVVARMLLNLAVDTAIGGIPFIGDLFDFGFKAHKRNLRLLEQRHVTGRATASDWLVVGGALLIFLAALAAPVIAVIALVRAVS